MASVSEMQCFLSRQNKILKSYSRDVRFQRNINHSVADHKSKRLYQHKAAKQQNLFIVRRVVSYSKQCLLLLTFMLAVGIWRNSCINKLQVAASKTHAALYGMLQLHEQRPALSAPTIWLLQTPTQKARFPAITSLRLSV